MNQPGLIYDHDDHEVQERVKTILGQLGDLTPAMETIGEMAKTSISRNFEDGGRPDRWEDLADATKAKRIKTRTWPGEILVNKGNLKRISYAADKQSVVISAANVPYAAIHHFGGQAGRHHATNIPARPYLLLQDEDVTEVHAILADFAFGVHN